MNSLPQKLNRRSTKIFETIISNLNNDYLKIQNAPFMPLTVEMIGTCEMLSIGEVDRYSLCHYYEQNGDLMQDPEMCFLITADYDYDISVYPYMYQQENLGIYEESITVSESGNLLVHEELYKKHLAFAESWLTNLKEQGFLLQIKKQQNGKPNI